MLGILALLLGVVLVGALFGLAAIVLGVIGRSRARRGEATNGGMALAGIILGVLGILVSIFVVVSVTSLFGEEFSSLAECIEQAGTQAEVEECERDFQEQRRRLAEPAAPGQQRRRARRGPPPAR